MSYVRNWGELVEVCLLFVEGDYFRVELCLLWGWNIQIFYAVFGCTELGLVLNWQWKTRFPNSMEYHNECLDARGIQL